MILQHPEGEACTVGASLSLLESQEGSRSRCRAGEVRVWELSLPESPSTTFLSSFSFFFFFSYFYFFFFSPPLLERTCLALKMLKVPLLAGEGQAESLCLILTA